MPSQRLLKMLDPNGHVAGLVTTKRVVLLWFGNDLCARWAASEVAATGLVPVRALAARHISASLAVGARPVVDIAVIDFDTIGRDQMHALSAARWGGYSGQIIAVAQRPLSAQVRSMFDIATTVVPYAPDALALAVRSR